MTTPTARKGLDEIRDEVARLHGWKWQAESQWWTHDDPTQDAKAIFNNFRHDWHPFPATLDGAASAMREGWLVKIEQCYTLSGKPVWVGHAYFNRGENDAHAGILTEIETEIECRFALALAALEASAKKS